MIKQEGQELIIEHVISIRKKIEQKEVVSEIQNMKKIILDLGETPKDLITATFGAEKNESGEMVMDIEILCPVSKELNIAYPFVNKKELRIINALKTEFSGPVSEIESVYNKINTYILERKLQPITAAYTLNKNGCNASGGQADIVVYVGINPNVL